MRSPAVILYTRRNCSLCDKARAAIASSGVTVDVTEVDIDTDALLHDLYTDHVPVIFVDGKEAFRHFVHAEEFADYVRNRN
jgi:glutaredoxin